MELTKSNEDYLEAICELVEEHGQAQVRDIAEKMKVKMPSVTVSVRQLSDMGLVEYKPYSPVLLTKKGMQLAQRVMKSHHILQEFFEKKLGLDSERADVVACQIEHILSLEEIQKLIKCQCS